MSKPSLIDKVDHALFNAIYSRNLVYNTCWEDPAIDRQALALGPDDTMLVTATFSLISSGEAPSAVRRAQ